MAKIAIIGAGSLVFGKAFLNDLLGVAILDGCEIALMGPTEGKLKAAAGYVGRAVGINGLRTEVRHTTDLREAVRGADYVIATFGVGPDMARVDKEVPARYGVDQIIGDTLGPGGVFRAARTAPAMMRLAEEVARCASPDAVILNYVNPMAIMCLTLGRHTDVRFVGLCHGVQTTLGLIAKYTGVDKAAIDYHCAGINHMAWFLEIKSGGADLYPVLRENIERPEYYLSEKVRCEVMRQFGYFMTESTDHLSEYLYWFRKSRESLGEYCDMPIFNIKKSGGGKAAPANPDIYAAETGELEPRSEEYCSHIIEAMEGGGIFKFNGNFMNDGYVANLPADSCVEVPAYADRTGMHPTRVGSLPPQLAALNQSNVTVQSLAAEAAHAGDPELLFSAVAMDPLTSAVLTLREAREMVGEMLEAQRGYLPQFGGRSLRKVHKVEIPVGTVGVEIPVDPALAVAKRIERLIGGQG